MQINNTRPRELQGVSAKRPWVDLLPFLNHVGDLRGRLCPNTYVALVPTENHSCRNWCISVHPAQILAPISPRSYNGSIQSRTKKKSCASECRLELGKTPVCAVAVAAVDTEDLTRLGPGFTNALLLSMSCFTAACRWPCQRELGYLTAIETQWLVRHLAQMRQPLAFGTS